MGMEQDGSSPHSGIGRPSFLHGASSPSYLPGHTPPHGHEHFPYPDQLSVYTSINTQNFSKNFQMSLFILLQAKAIHQVFQYRTICHLVQILTLVTIAVLVVIQISLQVPTRGWESRPVHTTDPTMLGSILKPNMIF